MQIRYETMKLTMHPTKLSNGRHGGSRVEPLPIPENWQVRMADQAMYHQGNQSVFVGGRLWTLLPPPALGLKRKRTEGRKREKFYIYLDVTHTHPARAGSTLKGKRKKKADTRRANGQKQRRGEGNRRTSGTNLHGETDLNKTAHTPKPHDTLRRGTRGN